MKKYIKEIIPAIILALVTSFMFFIYEPIIMYSNNINDFWFDIYTLFSCNIIIFLICFVTILLIYSLLYIINKYVLKDKTNIYYICLAIGYIVFITTYIQGNYFSSSLPLLDGSAIIWSNYKNEMIISAILLALVTILTIVFIIKYKYQKVLKVLKYFSLAIFVMLSVSLISTCLTKNCLTRKDYIATATTKNLNIYSTNKNFIIFLLDAVDSQRTNKIVNENEEYQNIFEDFTYYPDTVSGYVFTRDSIPLILTGNWSENKIEFSKFYNEAMRNSKLFDMLKEKKYDVNIYDEELIYNSNDTDQIKNLSFDTKINKLSFYKQELKYILFKYLPFYLKSYSKIESMNFNETKINNNENTRFVWDNQTFYNTYLREQTELNSNNQFKFIHIEGAHSPFECDENLQPINNGTYEQKVKACLKIIDEYLNYLKTNQIYDNSVIIVMADHGYEYETEATLYRQNPILYIKGINEKHAYRSSPEKVSFDNLMDMYKNLLDDKDTNSLFVNIDTSKPRRILLHETYNYNHLTEYMQTGHARDYSTTIATGNEFWLED